MFLTLFLRYWYIVAIAALLATNALLYNRWTAAVESEARARGAFIAAIEHQNARVAEWESAATEAQKRAAEATRKAQEASKRAADRVASIRAEKAPTGDCETRENAALDLIRKYRRP